MRPGVRGRYPAQAERDRHLRRRPRLRRPRLHRQQARADAAHRLAGRERRPLRQRLRDRVRVQPQPGGTHDRPVSAALRVRRERGGRAQGGPDAAGTRPQADDLRPALQGDRLRHRPRRQVAPRGRRRLPPARPRLRRVLRLAPARRRRGEERRGGADLPRRQDRSDPRRPHRDVRRGGRRVRGPAQGPPVLPVPRLHRRPRPPFGPEVPTSPSSRRRTSASRSITP